MFVLVLNGITKPLNHRDTEAQRKTMDWWSEPLCPLCLCGEYSVPPSEWLRSLFFPRSPGKRPRYYRSTSLRSATIWKILYRAKRHQPIGHQQSEIWDFQSANLKPDQFSSVIRWLEIPAGRFQPGFGRRSIHHRGTEDTEVQTTNPLSFSVSPCRCGLMAWLCR